MALDQHALLCFCGNNEKHALDTIWESQKKSIKYLMICLNTYFLMCLGDYALFCFVLYFDV